MNGRKFLANKDRTLGGSSAINLGMVVYPSRSGLNTWGALGNPGWNWDELAPYIQKLQKSTPPSESNRDFFKGIKYDEKSEGIDGPVYVSLGDQYMPFHPRDWRPSRALCIRKSRIPSMVLGLARLSHLLQLILSPIQGVIQ